MVRVVMVWRLALWLLDMRMLLLVHLEKQRF